METKMILRLTRSQQMAILDVLMEYTRTPNYTEVFINCSTSPPMETTIGDLLTLFSLTPELEDSPPPQSPTRPCAEFCICDDCERKRADNERTKPEGRPQ